MNIYTLEADFQYIVEPQDALTMEQFLDLAYEHLVSELLVADLNIISEEATRSLSVSLSVSAPSGESVETTIGRGLGTLRTAFHACGAGTPNWPTTELVEFCSVRLVQTVPDHGLATGHPELVAH